MKTNRIEKIAAYAKEKTKSIISLNRQNETGIDALNCSLDLGLDRANVSKDLNTLWKDGKLIKIQGKPVYFLDYETLIDTYPNSFFPSVISKNESLSNYFNTEYSTENKKRIIPEKDPLNSIIGSNGSLKEIIANAKSAASYPPFGLSCIISGNPGVGKSHLANRIHDYACIKKGKEIPFATIYCQNYLNDQKSFIDEMLGYRKRNGKEIVNGIFDSCRNGIILFEQIELLPVPCLNLLNSILTRKSYTPNGSLVSKDLQSMILLTTEESIDAPSLKTLSKSIPVHLDLLDVDKRGLYEKIELILDLFQREAKKINTTIHVKKDIITCLAQAKYPNNIIEMSNEIQIACSKAYFNSTNSSSSTVYVTYQDISIHLLSLNEKQLNLNSTIMNLMSCIPADYLEFNADGSSSAASIFYNAPTVYSEHRFNQFLNEFSYDVSNIENMDNYILDNISVLKNCPETQLLAMKKNINPIVHDIVYEKISHQSKFNSLCKNFQLLFGILLHITNYLNRMEKEENKSDGHEDVKSYTRNLYPEEYKVADSIYSSLSTIFSFTPSIKEIDFLSSYLFIINQWANNVNVGVLLIMHGESVATQLVNYVKQVVNGNYYVDALNFNNSMQLNDCLELACIKCTELNRGAGVVILCDMEPLTSIGEYVQKETHILTRTISGVSLPKIISVVEKSKSQFNNILSFDNETASESTITGSISSSDEFVNQIVDKVISKTVNFIDLKKVIPLLLDSLSNITKALNMNYSNVLCIKFLCHSSVMLERVIKNETWEFQKLNTFITANHKLMHIIEHSMDYLSSVLGIKIPAEELAYLAQIFILQKEESQKEENGL